MILSIVVLNMAKYTIISLILIVFLPVDDIQAYKGDLLVILPWKNHIASDEECTILLTNGLLHFFDALVSSVAKVPNQIIVTVGYNKYALCIPLETIDTNNIKDIM